MGGGFSHFKDAQFPAAKPPMFAMSLTGRNTSLKETMLLTYCPVDARNIILTTIREYWKPGIKKQEEINSSCYKIKIDEFPFEVGLADIPKLK